MLTPTDLLRRGAVAGFTLLLAVLIGGSAALADPTAEEERAARDAGNSAAAEYACDLIPGINVSDTVKNACVSSVATSISRLGDFDQITESAVCAPFNGMLAPFRGACKDAVSNALDGIISAGKTAYDNTLGKAGEFVNDAKEAVEFVQDPQSALEDLANTIKDNAVGFLNQVMGELVNVGNADFTASWWRDSYAAAGGIGLVIAGIMMTLVLKDAARDRISAHQFGESVQYLFAGIISMVWAPVLAYVVQDLIAAFNAGIIEWGGEDLYETILEGTIYSTTASVMPGGVLMGLVFWFLLFIGAGLVFIMFIAQGMAVYMTSLAMAIAFGMLAHPRWRAKALRVPMLVLGIMLAKPALLFVITALFRMIQNWEPMSLIGSDALQTLGEGLMIVLALFLIGLAPWAAFRFVPLLPDGSEVDGGGFNPASAGAGAAGSLMMTMGMRRMQTSAAPAASNSSGPAPGSSSGTMRAAPEAPGQGKGAKAPATSPVQTAAPKAGGAAKSGAAAKAGAAGGSGKLALAGGSAASGGTLLLAAAAAKGGQQAASTARTAAESSAPQPQSAPMEEQQSSLHDRRKLVE